MNKRFLRAAFANPAFIIGLALFMLGSGLLFVFGVLQLFGYFPGNTGLGFGLLFFFTVWPALALIVGGLAVTLNRLDESGGKGGAA